MYTISRADEWRWYLTGVEPETQRMVGPNWISTNEYSMIGCNDGYVYGDTPWDGFEPGHIALPTTYDEVLDRMDTSAYALVNNPNPEDRLHLRETADKSAQSLGKFYNRTPVQVLKRGDTWTKVRISVGEASLTGYMMTKFLAFGREEKAALACAFPQKHMQDTYWDQGVLLLDQPAPGKGDHGRYYHASGDFIIGVVGDEWYIVMRADGAVGYVQQSAFWDGNG